MTTAETSRREARASWSLARALLVNLVVHALAMLAMAALLLPMMPGGTDASAAERVAALAEHPWTFRMGWWPRCRSRCWW